MIPKPWCTKSPRGCAEIVGVINIIMTLLGGMLFSTLPIYMLDLEYEVSYIKGYHLGKNSFNTSGISPENLYTLNVTGTYNRDCDFLSSSFIEFLDAYLKRKTYFAVNVTRRNVIQDMSGTTKILCEIHVLTQRRPSLMVVGVKGIKYSVQNIVAQSLSMITKEDQEEIEKKMRIIPPNSDQVAFGVEYPLPVGNDPERISCITVKMLDVRTSDVLETEKSMYTLVGASITFSLVGGVLLVCTVFVVSRLLLTLTFVIESISTILMVGGIFVVNNPALCLYQYGGLSTSSGNSPGHMQTVITYSCSLYVVTFKLYTLWLIAAYAEIAPSIEKISESSTKIENHSETVTVAGMAEGLTEGEEEEDDDDDEDGSGNDDFVFGGSATENNDRRRKRSERWQQKGFGNDSTLVSQKKDKKLLANTFFGGI